MNSRALIHTALDQTPSTGLKSIADSLFVHSYSRLVYAQVWEDAELDLLALQLPTDANIVTLSSGGCNALAYLSAKPKLVHAIDVSSAHLAMLEIKQKAIKHLVDYQAVLAFLGHAQSEDNMKRYQRHLRQHLSAESLSFWESRSITGKPRYSHFQENTYQHGLLGNAIGLAHWLVRLCGGDLQALSKARNLQEQETLFAQHVAPVFDHPLLKMILRQPFVLYSLGIPLSQFSKLKKEADQYYGKSLPALIKERIRRLACHFLISENCFAQQAFSRAYDCTQQQGLPLYLQEKHYATLRQHINHLQTHHTTITQFLRQQSAQSLNAYVLHDVQDWMGKEQMTELWQEISRTAAPNAKVLFRTAASSSPIQEILPSHLLSQWHTDQGRNTSLHALDKSAIYGGLFVYEKQ